MEFTNNQNSGVQCMKALAKIFVLGDDALTNSAFTLGFFSIVDFPKDAISHPIISTLAGSIGGCVFAVGANVASIFIPDIMRPYVSAMCLLSVVYWQIYVKFRPEYSFVKMSQNYIDKKNAGIAI